MTRPLPRRAGLVAATCLAVLGWPRSAPAIVHGVDTDGELAVVALEARGQILCTGTLIARSAVVTAGHCVSGPNGKPEHVVFGSKLDGGRSVAVRAVLADPRFVPATLAHDLGLVLLAAPVLDVAPARLGTMDFAVDSGGSDVELVGFGVDQTSGVVPSRKHRGAARVYVAIGDGFAVAPDPAISCGGDSGAPAFFGDATSRRLVGIVSSSDALCAKRAMLTRVDGSAAAFFAPYLDDVASAAPQVPQSRWIASVVAGLVACLLARVGWVLLRRRRRRAR